MENNVDVRIIELEARIKLLIEEIEKLRVENFKLKTKLNYSEDVYTQLLEKLIDKVSK